MVFVSGKVKRFSGRPWLYNRFRRDVREVLIKEMDSGYIPEVIKVHLESFEVFFLSFLGPAFLRELYASLIKDPFGICRVAQNENAVLGFRIESFSRTPEGLEMNRYDIDLE